MLNETLAIAFVFITRIGLPIAATFVLGGLIERALQRAARAGA